MAKTRLLGQTPSNPKTPIDWERLLRRAIERADKVSDSRGQVLKTALRQGKAETTLKRMGIIGDPDLLREFPIRST